MNTTAYARALCVTLLLAAFPVNDALAETEAKANAQPRVATEVLVAEAEAVIRSVSVDNVTAAEKADVIFTAANRLFDEGQLEQSQALFQSGLQLAPWDMQQQLNFARVLQALGENQRAAATAKLVYQTSENASLLLQSGEIGGLSPPAGVLPLPDKKFPKPVFAIVRVGEVSDWIVQRAGNRLSATLGSPVYVSSTVIELPPPQRSYLRRWSEKLKKDISWDHPFVREQMRQIGVTMPELVTLDQVLEIHARIAVAQGEADPRPDFAKFKQQAEAMDRQWDAARLMLLLRQEVPARDNVVVIGITQEDIFAGDTNFVFGTADTGSHYALVSTRRFEAVHNGERENQQRFLDRLHKQLLSSSGFALGIPRPTDPRSARSYPNGIADHDLKGTWLSQACIDAFATALGHPLPEETVRASLAQ
jgi:predicted Zn-dependent protease